MVGTGRASDRGYLSVELTGMVVIVAVTILLLWQSVLAGYTLLLASRAADASAREAAVHLPGPDAAAEGEAAGHEALPEAWDDGSSIDVTVDGNRAQAQVDLDVPVLLPGWLGSPLTVTASSAASP